MPRLPGWHGDTKARFMVLVAFMADSESETSPTKSFSGMTTETESRCRIKKVKLTALLI